MTFPECVPERRRWLTGAAGLLAASTLPACVTAPPPRRALDFKNPRDNLLAYVKMIGDLSGKTVYGTHSGHIFAVVGTEMTRPLCGFTGFGLGHTKFRDDGKVEVSWREMAVYTDLDTGAILDRWRNPYSGETVEVMDVENDPVNFLLSETLTPLPAGSPREFRFGNYGHDGKFILPWVIDKPGDRATILYDVHGTRPNPLDPKEWPRESSGPRLRVSETFQYSARLSDLENPNLTTARYIGGWQRIASWLPWMLMDGRPGHLFYRSVTRSLGSAGEIDPALRARAQERYPKFLTPPDTWSMENVGSFDVFKARRRPAPPLERKP